MMLNKRAHPSFGLDSEGENLVVEKRGRWDDVPTSSRKRALVDISIERAKEEERAQMANKFRALLSSNEALKNTINEMVAERERNLHDNRILKAGVLKLKANNDHLSQELNLSNSRLREACERYRALESAVIAAQLNKSSLGGCRKDDKYGDEGGFDGDVF